MNYVNKFKFVFYKKHKCIEVNVNLMLITSNVHYELLIHDVVKTKTRLHKTLLDYRRLNH